MAAAADRRYDVIAFGAHPDDLEVVLGGTAARLVRAGRSVLFVDLCNGEPARHAGAGARQEQAAKAAAILGVDRVMLTLHDRLIADTVEARLQVASLLRRHRPSTVFTTLGSGVHPDHKAVTDIVTNGIFYARLPKWEEVGVAHGLDGTEPHEIDRLFFGHCRMEPVWDRFDFAIDVTDVYDTKMAAILAYESVFSGAQADLVDKYSSEDRFIGAQVGVRYAEAFRARSPLLVDLPSVFKPARFG